MTAALIRRARQPRRLFALLATGWLALPWLAQAQTPTLNPETLGITESILNYCGPIDPALAGKLQERAKELVQGVSEQQLAQVRQSDEYHKAYESVAESVAKVDALKAKRICSESAAASK